VLSVSGRNVPREYELTYVVRFSVEGAAGTLLPAEEVSVSREFSFDERAVLAKEREQEVLRAALARDLAGVVLNRLASLK
jgi:LPS-assembly lipoprotein